MRLNRLFWKIFLAVWLTSLSVIIVTVIVIGEVAERNSARRMNEYRATEMAQIIIERLEAGAVYNPDGKFSANPAQSNGCYSYIGCNLLQRDALF